LLHNLYNGYKKYIITFALSFLSHCSNATYSYEQCQSTSYNEPKVVLQYNSPSNHNFSSFTATARHQNIDHYALKQSSQTYNYQPNFSHIHTPLKTLRTAVLEQFLNNDCKTHHTFSQSYYPTSLSKQYLLAHNINRDLFEKCEGNLLQHTIHQEFITLTDQTAHLWNQYIYSPDIKNLTAIVGDFIAAGNAFNHAQNIKKAISLADAGWALLDCIGAFVEGTKDGITTIAHDILHPIETIQSMAYSVATCGYYLGKAAHEVYSFTENIILGDLDAVHDQYSTWTSILQNIIDQLRTITLHDGIKLVTKSAIESYAVTRTCNGFSNLFTGLRHKQH
jgi:hypothetical protein